ncbi:MAG: FAD-dependent oxidoreductase [Rudaea sp.]
MSSKAFDFVVIGAGVFGAWTAHELLRDGHTVLLLDAYGPAHSRSSSGGESRIMRMGYGADELYSRMAMVSLQRWKDLQSRLSRQIFHPTGMLWLAGKDDAYTRQNQQVLERLGVAHHRLELRDIENQYPQIGTDGIAWALLEPDSGVLMARQAVQALVADAIAQGLEYRTVEIAPPQAKSKLDHLVTQDGETINAGGFVFACGPWLPKLFPDLLAPRIFPTRQEVFFFAPPAGDSAFASAVLPAWLDHAALVYGIPDLENRGFKISIDKHGPAFDPDNGERLVGAESLAAVRDYIAARFPKLKNAVLTESRVCQYANTSNGDFIIDRHPEIENVTIVGGGSGHGFKHGPAVGDYARRLLTTQDLPEPRFALAAKATMQARSVY